MGAAFMLTIAGWRIAQGPGVASWDRILHRFRDRLADPEEDDGALADAISAEMGYAWTVATYTGSFELRKVQLTWTSQDQATSVDDVRVATFHFLKLAGGSPVSTWDAGDFSTLMSNFNTWWVAINGMYGNETKLDHLKVYKDGPGIEPPNPPVYDGTINVGGTSGYDQLPPQVAISVTEKAGSRLYWGRFYLPAPHNVVCNQYGRLTSAATVTIADATDALYTALRAANLAPVVYRRELAQRQTAAEKRSNTTPGSLPPRAASAWDITDIQVDDVFDVIRSRRWKYPTLRTQRAV